MVDLVGDRFLQLSYKLGSEMREFNLKAYTLKDAIALADDWNLTLIATRHIKNAASFINKSRPTIIYNPHDKSEPMITLMLLHEIMHHKLGHIRLPGQLTTKYFDEHKNLMDLEERAVDALSRIMMYPLRLSVDSTNIRHKELPEDMRVMQAESCRFKSFPHANDFTSEELEDWSSIRAWVFNKIIKRCNQKYRCNSVLNCLDCKIGKIFFKV